MEAPGLKTRAKNKLVRPGVNAGVEKKTRRTQAEMAQARTDETTAKARAALDQKKALKQLAALEDQQHRDDIAYAATANHPIDKAKIPAVADSVTTPQPIGDDSRSGDDSDEYQQPNEDSQDPDPDPDPDSNSDSDSDSNSDADADDDNDAEQPKKKKKPKVTSRADVIASRTTRDSTGTPAVDGASTGQKRKAVDKSKASGKKATKKPKTSAQPKKKSGLDDRRSKSQVKDASAPEDDSMVVPGGPALDDDKAEHVERPQKGKKKKGMPNAPPLDIKPIALKELTGKAARGGDAKWQLKHLPADTAEKFTNEVVPLACELAGVNSTGSQWDGLTVAQIQTIVDKVYGANKYVVRQKDVWTGLIGYRLHDWHNGFAAHAEKVVQGYFEGDNSEGEEEENKEGPTDDIPPVDGAVPKGTTPAPTVRKFNFSTPAGRAEFVEWALQLDSDRHTMAFHWVRWGDGVDKQGFLQHDLILCVFTYYFSRLEAIPTRYTRLTAPPISALLLAVQALQRALQFWRTGVYNNPQPTPRANWFSSEHWDDYTIPNPNPRGAKDKLVRRGTKFMASVKKWDTARWDEVKERAKSFMEAPTRRRAASSRSTSEAGDAIFSDDDEVIIVSD
ncbi:hypothetical protein B0H10DRAFT_2304101 [Mycena sp. CBHHK59/15]|nr:hypothetical protein B0H10DRAFT_2304101 [Mycena sp. CBHHK59/15]